jgi:SAM-dependent methyltransferase
MGARHEVERIASVYRGYADEGAAAGRWSPANPGNRAIVAERLDGLRALFATGPVPLDRARVLEVGCGNGDVLASLVALGAQADRLCGVDLLPDLVADARARHHDLRFEHGNAEALAFDDAAFDYVLLFTVLTSILDEQMARRLAHEVDRVLAPGGAVVWYDFRVDNPWNRHVRGRRSGGHRGAVSGIRVPSSLRHRAAAARASSGTCDPVGVSAAGGAAGAPNALSGLPAETRGMSATPLGRQPRSRAARVQSKPHARERRSHAVARQRRRPAERAAEQLDGAREAEQRRRGGITTRAPSAAAIARASVARVIPASPTT